jgi:hypothetical protein
MRTLCGLILAACLIGTPAHAVDDQFVRMAYCYNYMKAWGDHDHSFRDEAKEWKKAIDDRIKDKGMWSDADGQAIENASRNGREDFKVCSPLEERLIRDANDTHTPQEEFLKHAIGNPACARYERCRGPKVEDGK